MSTEKPWEDSEQYKTIQRILNDYWITQKDEYAVSVTMSFIHNDGRTHEERIFWFNPLLYRERKRLERSIQSIDNAIEGLKAKRRNLLTIHEIEEATA